MKNKRIISIIALGLAGSVVSTNMVALRENKVENVRLLAQGSTTINNNVNSSGTGNNVSINENVNNGNNDNSSETNNSSNQNSANGTNQVSTPASSKTGYEAGQVIVTLGANLTAQEKQQMLTGFGVTEGQSGVKFITTTNKDIAIELGLNPNNIIPGSTSISSCKVTLLPAGSGISVSTNNLTEVTGDMLASALTTCGITDASIVANAPYAVTGQAALAGILQGFQAVTGTTIPEQNKVVANNEVNVTTSLGNQIGQAKAEKIVTEAKKQVVDTKPETTGQVINIVNNVSSNNGITLTTAQQQELTNLMNQIKSLNLNASKVNSTLNAIQNSINNGKKDFSNVSSAISNEYDKLKSEGFFTKIGHDIENFFHDVYLFFTGGTKAVEGQSNTGTNATTGNSNSSTTTAGTSTNNSTAPTTNPTTNTATTGATTTDGTTVATASSSNSGSTATNGTTNANNNGTTASSTNTNSSNNGTTTGNTVASPTTNSNSGAANTSSANGTGTNATTTNTASNN
ncbi:MAG: DUF1002 domain-containing protein [Sarcina sp.]